MQESLDRVGTGVGGLDEVLDGGFVSERTYMLRGRPGAGKSILGLEFLVAGADAGEDVLYVAMEEPEREIRRNAASLGIDVEDVSFLDMSPDSSFFAEDRSYDVFAPEEVEGDAVADRITDRVESLAPSRVFVDPIGRLRGLSPDEYQFGKQVLSFMQLLRERGTTVVFTSQATTSVPDEDLQFLCDGVVELDRSARGRTVSVPKFRGSDTLDGDHALRIEAGGVRVFPRIVPREHGVEFDAETLPSGVPELDSLLGGGIERGTVTIVTGSPGVGKTTTGVQFVKEAASRGERSVVYSFEEARHTLLDRCEAVDIPVREMIERGTLAVEEVEPLRLSATEFAHTVREEVEANDTGIVMIDGVEGYRQALRDGEEDLTRELHALCRYLKNVGVTVVLMNELPTVVGEFRLTEAGLSYLSDGIVFIRHVETNSRIRKVVGVLKKRTSDFERTVREFRITEAGVTVGEPLEGMTGILTGSPRYDPGARAAGRPDATPPGADEHRPEPGDGGE
jgi:circadian clock protein KaiC